MTCSSESGWEQGVSEEVALELRQVREQGLRNTEGECSECQGWEGGPRGSRPASDSALLRIPLQVMDEADRLLEQGCTDFTVDLEAILAAVPAHRQTLLFSATLTDTLKELQGLATNQPFFWEAQAP